MDSMAIWAASSAKPTLIHRRIPEAVRIPLQSILIDAALSSGALENDQRLQFRRLQYALRPSTISPTCLMNGAIQAPPPLLHRVVLHFVRPLHPSSLLRRHQSLLRQRRSLLPWRRICAPLCRTRSYARLRFHRLSARIRRVAIRRVSKMRKVPSSTKRIVRSAEGSQTANLLQKFYRVSRQNSRTTTTPMRISQNGALSWCNLNPPCPTRQLTL